MAKGVYRGSDGELDHNIPTPMPGEASQVNRDSFDDTQGDRSQPFPSEASKINDGCFEGNPKYKHKY